MKIYLKTQLTVLAAAAFFLSAPATAQIYEMDPFSTDYFTKVTWDDINRRTSEELKDAQRKKSASTPQRSTPQRTAPRQVTSKQASPRPVVARVSPAAAAALNFRPTGALAQSRGVNVLASQYGRNQQGEMKANYVAMINSFNDTVPRMYGVQKNNMATGTAALLTGAYVAYNNRPFPDAWVRPLVRQLESTMVNDPSLTNASAIDKETAYHVMVGTGMALQVSQAQLAKSPDARRTAQLRRMGAEVFRSMNIADPSRVQFSAEGVSFR